MTQFFFNRNTIDNLKFYVYGLKDPFTNKYFYIGKGKANRVFSHVNQKIKRGIDDPKYEKIQEIRLQGGKVKIDIIRHGLDERQALLIESCLIDTLGVNQMANKVKGIDHDRFGLMPVNVIKQIYKGKDFKTSAPCVCFKINRAWSKNITVHELYEKTRSWWRLSETRSQKAMYGIGIAFGIIRSIYKINSWENGKKHNRPTRIRFHGEKALDMQKHIGDSMLNQPNHKVSGPTFYINC